MTVVDKSNDITVTLAPDIKQPNRIIAEHSGSAAGLFTANSQSNGDLYYYWSNYQPNVVLFNCETYNQTLNGEFQVYTPSAEQAVFSNGVNPHSVKVQRIVNQYPLGTLQAKIALNSVLWPRNYDNFDFQSDWEGSVAKLYVNDTQGNARQDIYPRQSQSTEYKINSGDSEQNGSIDPAGANGTRVMFRNTEPVVEQGYTGSTFGDMGLGQWLGKNAVLFWHKFATGSSNEADLDRYGDRLFHNGNFSDHINEGETIYCTVVGIDSGNFATGATTNVFVKYASWTWEEDDDDGGGGGGRGDLSVLPVQSRPVALRWTRLAETFEPKLRTRIR